MEPAGVLFVCFFLPPRIHTIVTIVRIRTLPGFAPLLIPSSVSASKEGET